MKPGNTKYTLDVDCSNPGGSHNTQLTMPGNLREMVPPEDVTAVCWEYVMSVADWTGTPAPDTCPVCGESATLTESSTTDIVESAPHAPGKEEQGP